MASERFSELPSSSDPSRADARAPSRCVTFSAHLLRAVRAKPLCATQRATILKTGSGDLANSVITDRTTIFSTLDNRRTGGYPLDHRPNCGLVSRGHIQYRLLVNSRRAWIRPSCRDRLAHHLADLRRTAVASGRRRRSPYSSESDPLRSLIFCCWSLSCWGSRTPSFGDTICLISEPTAVGDRPLRRPITHWHGLTANIVLGLAALHAAAALFHHYAIRDSVLARMAAAREV